MSDRPTHCAGPGCRNELPAPKKTGRPRKFCSDTCRYAAADARELVVWHVGEELAALPIDPLTQQRRTLACVAELLDGRPALPAEDQVVHTLIEAQRLSFTFRRLGVDVTSSLAEPITFIGIGIADLLRQALPSLFDEELRVTRPKDPTRGRRGTGHRPMPGEANLSIVPAIPDHLDAAHASGSSSIDAVPCPADLPVEARGIWEAAMLELAGQRLKVADLEALRQMCTAAARARQAAKDIAKYGLVVEGKRGPTVNPLTRIERDATFTYLRIAEQYGLTLASRLRLGLMQLTGQSLLTTLNDDLEDPVVEAQVAGEKKPPRKRAHEKKPPAEPT